jgi:hypothetical protein
LRRMMREFRKPENTEYNTTFVGLCAAGDYTKLRSPSSKDGKFRAWSIDLLRRICASWG